MEVTSALLPTCGHQFDDVGLSLVAEHGPVRLVLPAHHLAARLLDLAPVLLKVHGHPDFANLSLY